jgi:hypothetical protein
MQARPDTGRRCLSPSSQGEREERKHMKKFELFMCCQGNGLTVYNKAVSENGDYKQIAHIANCGKITWYVNPSTYVPGSDLLRIEHTADTAYANWKKWLDNMPDFERLYRLYNMVPVDVYLYVSGSDLETWELGEAEQSSRLWS